jgi:hypothetical protein
MTVRPALGHSNTMRIRSVFVVAGLMLRCGGSTLVGNNDAQPHPADGSSPSMTADTGGGDEGAILSGADATAASRVDGSATATGPGAGPCSFFTCPDGCCLDDGGCFAYSGESTDIPCGSNGEACRTCPSGESCIPNIATAGPSIGRAGRSGGCQRDLGEPCTPENCAGCCFVADVNTDSGSVFSTQCFEGSQDNYCGSAGTACLRCTPATNGGHCVADSTGGGHCEGAGQCNATNCAGCCAGAFCVQGAQDVACGSHGAACQNCTDGGLCVAFAAGDGGVATNVCGYDCASPFGVLCASYCSSPSDCSPGPGACTGTSPTGGVTCSSSIVP